MLVQNVAMPDVPQPDSANWVPPSQSEYKVLNTDTSMDLLWRWGQDSIVMIEPKIGGQVIESNAVPDIAKRTVIALNGLPIPVYSVVSRTYWKNAGGWTIAPGDNYECDTSYTIGVSTTDTSSWSAEVGAKDGGFEAKISESFSHSVTLSDSKTIEYKNVVNGDPKLYTNFTLWLPVLEIVVLDDKGAPLVTRHEDRTALLRSRMPFLADQQAGIVLLSTVWTMPLNHPTESKGLFANLND